MSKMWFVEDSAKAEQPVKVQKHTQVDGTAGGTRLQQKARAQQRLPLVKHVAKHGVEERSVKGALRMHHMQRLLQVTKMLHSWDQGR